MNDREKLIALLAKLDTYGCEECQKCVSFKYDLPCDDKCFCEKTADHLIANGVTIQRWIPVEERLPEVGEIVLVCGNRGGIYTAYLERDGKYAYWHKLNSKNHYCKPTHWMPKPEPPIEEQNRARGDNDG